MNYEKSLWRDEFVQYTFRFEDRQAIVVFPSESNKTSRWLLKTEYFHAFQDLEYEMVKRGFHLVYLENRSRWVAEGDLEAKFRFRCFLMEEFGLAPKCIPVGMSCGGLHAIKQAGYFPEMISALYLDAPVVNLLSCPCRLGLPANRPFDAREEMLTALNMTMSELIAYRDHPLDHLPRLVRERIPVLLICGEADQVVELKENGMHIVKAYENTDIPFLFMLKPGCDHHPHGPAEDEMDRAISFLEEHAQ